jgi:hypothetical protein
MTKTSIPSGREADSLSQKGAGDSGGASGSSGFQHSKREADKGGKAENCAERAGSVAHLNDAFRQSFVGGAVLLTRGVAALPVSIRRRLLAAVRAFDEFEPGNDPYGEHDFGAVAVGTELFFWKIDAYDLDHSCASPDPTDPDLTRRVLTIMSAEEY